MSSPLVSAAELQNRSARAVPSLLDVRWELGRGARRDHYERGHIPGAAFVDLDRDLAGEPGAGGRHPLPAPASFAAAMRAAGVSGRRPVVVYDAASSMAAARAWWLLRFFGHRDVAVLDGGYAAWVSAGGLSATGSETPAAGDFVASGGGMAILDGAGAAALARRGGLLDARAPERFRGETEPIDSVAGHIPGARNLPTAPNVDESGRFRDPAALKAELTRIGVEVASPVGVYCGSGVTAAHEVLALELAGVAAALYPGSWSEWISDPQRPVAVGPD